MTNILLYAATVLSWGVAWYTIKFQIGVVPPTVSVAYRFVIAAALIFVWAALRRETRLPWRTHPWVAVQGVFLFCTNFLMFYFAAFYVTTALLAVTMSLASVVVPILNWVFRGQKIEPRIFLAAILGVTGLVVIFWPEVKSFDLNDAGMIGLLCSLGGMLSFSTGSVINARNQANGVPLLASTAWGMAYGAAFIALVSVALGQEFTFDTRFDYVASLIFLAVLAGVGVVLVLAGNALALWKPRRAPERMAEGAAG
jgi:drug/metabolite transporter (DMT)-like permease